ncbi:MAG: IPT/TIG domain-containing protein [Acidobacteriota bacterium]
MNPRAVLRVVAMSGLAAANATANSFTVNPASAWCSVVNAAAPGDTIVFSAGSYPDTCSVAVSGTAGSPITLRSQSSAPADRAVLAYSGTSSNIFDVSGSFLAFRWLTFGPTAAAAGVNPLKLRSSVQSVVVDQNVFQGTDIAVAANSSGSTYQNISITNNVLTNLQSTGLYFGCHDGTSCHALNILIRGNLINGVQPGDGVGYGLEIKLNSYATIVENTIYAAQGPGIEVYGSNRGDPASVVERNYVEGSKSDAGINVGGGPAIVRNNILVRNQYNGIWAQDYGGRGLQQNVRIVANTVLANQTGGIQVSNWQPGAGNVLAFNAIAPLAGTPALTPASPVAEPSIGNISCTPATVCFDQPNAAPYDLWPVAGGLLIGAAGNGSETWRPADDFLCVARGGAADAGAMQRTSPGSGPPVGGGNPRPPCGSSGPTISSLTPTFGPLAGGTRITILGANFQTGASVTLGTAAATSIDVVSGTTVTATTPASATTQTVGITVTNPDTRSATLPGAFTYNAGAGFYALTPCRVVDTRNSTGPLGGPALTAGADRTFVFAGACGIPSTARSVAIHVTVIQPSAGPGFLSFYPGGTALPLVSTLNYASGQTRSGNAIVPLGAAGDIAIRCGQGSGTAHAVVDVTGYFQ